MAFRNIIIKDRCKLEYSLNYLICRKASEEKKVLLDEIRLIVIDTTQASITTSLMAILAEKKIKLIICDDKHNATSELVPYYNNYYGYRKIKEQINFDDNSQKYLWKRIIEEKIKNQLHNLEYMKLEEANLLNDYKDNVELGDVTNREGHAAKVYFNALFGKDFSRRDDNNINKYLNYGYSIILSAINREIKSFGYLTELGIHHIGESNPFNLSCDFMEPLRPLIDAQILKNEINEENFRIKYIELLSKEVKYNNQNIILDNAIYLYVQNLLKYLKDKDVTNIKFISYEL